MYNEEAFKGKLEWIYNSKSTDEGQVFADKYTYKALISSSSLSKDTTIRSDYHDELIIRYGMSLSRKELKGLPYEKLKDALLSSKHHKMYEDLSKLVYRESGWAFFVREDAWEQDHDFKIYVPVENANLEEFTCRLLEKLMSRDTQYHFKINNDTNVTRSDNVCIYATKDNFSDYLDSIEEVLKENPEIKISYEDLHVLAYQYNDHIAVADYLDKEDQSYGSIVSDKILEAKLKSSSFEEFYDKTKEIISSYTEQTKNNLPNKDGTQKEESQVESSPLPKKEVVQISSITTNDEQSKNEEYQVEGSFWSDYFSSSNKKSK